MGHKRSLEVASLSKSYSGRPALAGVSFALARGEVLALLGPSGGGKSTLLSLIAGLEMPEAGDVRWEGQSLLPVPTHRRGFGLMFQDYALFPHKDVADNVGFGLKMQGKPRAEIGAGVQWALQLVGLAGFERRDVNSLSGGEQQRVALARALAPRPRLLMLDEPLGALDRTLRERLLDELGTILRQLQQTAIYVTHDQEEAFALADRIIILGAGRVVQTGRPEEVYAAPASRFVAEFLGLKNVLSGVIRVRAGRPTLVTAIGEFPVAALPPVSDGARIEAVLRPDGARVVEAAPAGAPTDVNGICLEGRLAEKSFRGDRHLVTLQMGDNRLRFEFPAGEALPAAGEFLRVRLAPTAIHVMPVAQAGDTSA
jgi:ABC-type Fe3+/spermidine/putrescine transport system ATPase subunit